jgi:lipopolysaccharide transport system ATP-binding protein
MTAISLTKVTLDFPVRNSTTSSLRRKTVELATGGRVKSEHGRITKVRALSDISMRVKEGERVGLFGHNGSGKSTLLRVMAGIFKPSSGSIHVDGKVSSSLDVMLGMDPTASGRDNISMMALYRGISPKAAAAASEEIADFAGLGHFIDLPVATYSSGMAMRLAFSVATSWSPDILLMDEWMSTGDENFVAKAESRLKLVVDNARAMVLASHSRELLSRLCDTIYILKHGQLFAFGSPEEVWRAYPKT